MSVQNQIIRIITARDSSFAALQSKGISVPANPTIEDLPGTIAAIQTRSSDDLSASGSIITVPSGYYATSASKAISSGEIYVQNINFNNYPPIGTITLNSETGNIHIARDKYLGTLIGKVSTAGYVNTSTIGTGELTLNSISTDYQLPTASASTYTPSSTTQTIPSGVYLTGVQTIEPIPISVDNHRLILPEGLISV